MFIWVDLPEDADIDKISEETIAGGVGVVKSEAFAVDSTNKGHGFRLNFSASEDEDIVKGSERFGKLLQKYF